MQRREPPARVIEVGAPGLLSYFGAALQLLVTIWIAVVGLCVGSFLNVVIARMPHADLDEPEAQGFWPKVRAALRFSGNAYRSLWTPKHSKCPKCGHQIRWFENVPVISWLALRGKCSSCKAPISPRYILVELLTGTLFVALLTRFPLDWQLVSALTFLTFLIPLIFIDAEHWILPFELTLPGILGGLLLAIPRGEDAFFFALWGAVAGFIAFRVMEVMGWLSTSFVYSNNAGVTRRVGRETLGMGDKYLLAMIGAQVGWRGLLGVVLLSSIQGSVVGIANLLLRGTAGPSETAPKESPLARWWRTPKHPGKSKLGLLWRRRQALKRLQTWGSDEVDELTFRPFTPECFKPNLPAWKRALTVPYTIFLQDIPDDPPPDETTGEIPDWEPQASNLPFGPWIGLAGIEVLLFGPRVVEALAHTPFRLMAEIIFGQ